MGRLDIDKSYVYQVMLVFQIPAKMVDRAFLMSTLDLFIVRVHLDTQVVLVTLVSE